ncbi:PP2C family protein-serine/threonine phosphatase [Cumulibacter soli]|uniref:PP2C family protein-serine/threonine phosphatase n=1 Tax=Cumulibacter soli TaxID=2546344 RepID=UPI0010684389|nr:protein phosphatase 2C domain-containing protein [Cumulibacter soli]
MPNLLRAAARTHLGLVRENNEDSFYVGDRLILVADGMGGHAAGEVASTITKDMLAALDREHPSDDITAALTQGIDNATAEIARQVADNPTLEGMGTTVTAVMFGDRRIAVANIGDSRAYLYQADKHKLTQLTSDDSFVQLMVDNGDITPDQAQHHPYRNVVLKSLNGQDVQPRFTTLRRIAGDRYLLCTDGLTDYVARGDIITSLDIADVDAAADRLVELALEAGAPDNVTVILIDILTADESAPTTDPGADTVTSKVIADEE